MGFLSKKAFREACYRIWASVGGWCLVLEGESKWQRPCQRRVVLTAGGPGGRPAQPGRGGSTGAQSQTRTEAARPITGLGRCRPHLPNVHPFLKLKPSSQAGIRGQSGGAADTASAEGAQAEPSSSARCFPRLRSYRYTTKPTGLVIPAKRFVDIPTTEYSFSVRHLRKATPRVLLEEGAPRTAAHARPPTAQLPPGLASCACSDLCSGAYAASPRPALPRPASTPPPPRPARTPPPPRPAPAPSAASRSPFRISRLRIPEDRPPTHRLAGGGTWVGPERSVSQRQAEETGSAGGEPPRVPCAPRREVGGRHSYARPRGVSELGSDSRSGSRSRLVGQAREPAVPSLRGALSGHKRDGPSEDAWPRHSCLRGLPRATAAES
ncbi:translation initiation factor IF-2-like [Mustela erminea]|uniref:translation initiation factor IF-2-like n=1 Tax=Mustela erminea TaxID=36723 RepID=UPI001386FD93|nr:translation initiation factor IF-2-like [Mustela erminea]